MYLILDFFFRFFERQTQKQQHEEEKTSKSQRLFPSRVLDTSGPVSVQISDPYKYDINVMKSTEGGKFSISKRFHSDMEKPRDEEAEKKKREEEKIRKKFEEGKKMLFVDTTTTCEEVEEEEDDTEVTTIEEENKKKDTFPYVVCYTFFSSHEKKSTSTPHRYELVTNEQGLDYLKCIWSEIHDE